MPIEILNHKVAVEDKPIRSWTGRYDPEDENPPESIVSYRVKCLECRWEDFGSSKEEAKKLGIKHQVSPILKF